MNLVKIGREYINPAQVVNVKDYLDSDGDLWVRVTFVNNHEVRIHDKLLEEVVALINSGL